MRGFPDLCGKQQKHEIDTFKKVRENHIHMNWRSMLRAVKFRDDWGNPIRESD